MDELDREIQEAARLTRRRQWRGRIASIASVATLFLVGIVGGLVVFNLFPEPDSSDFDRHRQEHDSTASEPLVPAITDDYAAYRGDQSRMRLKVLPVGILALPPHTSYSNASNP